MSLRIIKAGLFDTVQDGGRYGFAHLGINPGGAMDRFSSALVNALLGKEFSSPVLELHFPAPEILFEKAAIVCLAGADFSPVVNQQKLPLAQPVFLPANSVLCFQKRRNGARCYLGFLNDLHLEKWLGSFSTHLKAGAGGFAGRRLQTGDRIPLGDLQFLPKANEVTTLPWRYAKEAEETSPLQFLPGPEWDWLAEESRHQFSDSSFRITPASDRMGCRLQGETLKQARNEQLVSSAVSFGTVQLLPSGQLIVLMADHQTTGGYPRIANIIAAHLPKLAQTPAGEHVRFTATTMEDAERKMQEQQDLLLRLQNTCNLNLQNWFYAH